MSDQKTALENYTKLISSGLWRPAPDAQRVDVVVNLGEATLVLSDKNDQALAHWSLAAVRALEDNDGAGVIFTPDEEATEWLEITDPDMITAIKTVSAAVQGRAAATPRRLRVWVYAALIAAVLFVIFGWFPKALQQSALENVPPEKVAEFRLVAEDMLTERFGPHCATSDDHHTLNLLRTRLGLPDDQRISIRPLGMRKAMELPGGALIIAAEMLAAAHAPEALAGLIAETSLRASAAPALARLFDGLGTVGMLDFVMQNNIPRADLQAFAQQLINSNDPLDNQHDTELANMMRSANLPLLPYITLLREFGAAPTRLEQLRAADHIGSAPFPPLLEDYDWIALQGICDE